MNFILIITIISCIIIFNFNDVYSDKPILMKGITTEQIKRLINIFEDYSYDRDDYEYQNSHNANMYFNDFMYYARTILLNNHNISLLSDKQIMDIINTYHETNKPVKYFFLADYYQTYTEKYDKWYEDKYYIYEREQYLHSINLNEEFKQPTPYQHNIYTNQHIFLEQYKNKSNTVKYNDKYMFISVDDKLFYFDLYNNSHMNHVKLPTSNSKDHQIHVYNDTVYLLNLFNDIHMKVYILDFKDVKPNILPTITELLIPGHTINDILINDKLYLITKAPFEMVDVTLSNMYYFKDKYKSDFINIFVINKEGIIDNKSFLLDDVITYITKNNIYLIERDIEPIKTHQSIFINMLLDENAPIFHKDTQLEVRDIMKTSMTNGKKANNISKIMIEQYTIINDLFAFIYNNYNDNDCVKGIKFFNDIKKPIIEKTKEITINKQKTIIHRIDITNNITYIDNIKIDGMLPTGYSSINNYNDMLQLVTVNEYEYFSYLDNNNITDDKCEEFEDLIFNNFNRTTLYKTDIYNLNNSLNIINRIKLYSNDEILQPIFNDNILYLINQQGSYIIDLHTTPISSLNKLEKNPIMCNSIQYNHNTEICINNKTLHLIDTSNKHNHVKKDSKIINNDLSYFNKNEWSIDYNFIIDIENDLIIFPIKRQTNITNEGFLIYKITDNIEFKGIIYNEIDNIIETNFIINDNVIYVISNLSPFSIPGVQSYINVYDINTLEYIKTITTKYEIQINSHKFDPGFYDRVQCLINLQESEQLDTRYYGTILIVYGNENKQFIKNILEDINAKDIYVASLSFITADIPIHKIPILSIYDQIYAIGDGETQILPASSEFDHLRGQKRDVCDI